ncbi:MAG TPA: ABC transporter substrate-binding protein, partial [Alphaproteobacteria bacterium]|nr:ABC transporter substrate-binding protein [Alphaproteobacteria bacterium]
MTRTIIAAVSATVLGIAVAGTAMAQEVTLRAASSFASGTTFSREFERFVEKVNEEGKGLVQIEYVGGPEAIPPFETGNAVQAGVIDIANTTGAFYTNILPIADALKLAEISAEEMRQNGAHEFIDQLHREKMNVHYLARTGIGVPFHLYVNKEIAGPDLSGLRLRVTPVYRAFFQELGATAIQTPPGEVYTALER